MKFNNRKTLSINRAEKYY